MLLLFVLMVMGAAILQYSSRNERLEQRNQEMQLQYRDAISRIDRLQQDLLVLKQEAVHEMDNYVPPAMPTPTITPTPAPAAEDDEVSANIPAAPVAGDLGALDIAPEEQNIFKSANEKLTKLDYQGAIEEFSGVKKDSREYVTARLSIAQSYFYAHDYRRAIDEFEFVLELRPDLVAAAIGLANSHSRLGDHAAQVAALDRAIATEPGNWLHYNGRATARLAMGEYDLARKDYERAAKLAGQNKTLQANALENIGIIYLNREQWQEAFEHADDVNKIESSLGWNWLFRGIAAAQMEHNIDAYVSYDQWFKYRKATDPYLLKQLLPEALHKYVDVSVAGLPGLIDPPLLAGNACVNDYQCRSQQCRPGAPDNKSNYCVAEELDCAAENSAGFLAGELLEVDGASVRCYVPLKANPRWTRDNRG